MTPFVKETLTGLFIIAFLTAWVVIHVIHDLNNYNKRWKK